MKVSIKDFFGKCNQISWKLRIWSQLLKKPLMENFIFSAVYAFGLMHVSGETVLSYYFRLQSCRESIRQN